MARTPYKIYQGKEANAELVRLDESLALLASENATLKTDNAKLKSDMEAASGGESEALKTLKVDFAAQSQEVTTLKSSLASITTEKTNLANEVATLKTSLAEKPSRDAAAIVGATGTPNPLASTAGANPGAPQAEDFSKLSPFERGLAIRASEEKKRATLKQ